jgi:hypothetical protein
MQLHTCNQRKSGEDEVALISWFKPSVEMSTSFLYIACLSTSGSREGTLEESLLLIVHSLQFHGIEFNVSLLVVDPVALPDWCLLLIYKAPSIKYRKERALECIEALQ